MKNSKAKRQSIIVAILAFLLVGVVAIGMSSAWFQDHSTNSVTLKIGDYIDLDDTTVSNYATALTQLAATEYLPGDHIAGGNLPIKLMATDDTQPTDVVLRAKITPVGAAGTHKTDLENLVAITATGWNLGSDGYYYYGTVVHGSVAGTTVNLSWEATVPTAWGDLEADHGSANSYANLTMTITFQVDAIQAKNIADNDAFDDLITVSGTTVSLANANDPNYSSEP